MTYAKNKTLIAIAKPACNTTTNMSKILLVFASVALSTGYKLRRRKNTVHANPTPTKAQFNAVRGLQLANATAIQSRFAYPYKAQHSIRSALELPNQRNAPQSAMGITPVYPYIRPAAPESSRKSYSKCSSCSCARYCDIVPVKKRIITTVVAIQNGPYKSGFPSRTSRKLERGYTAAMQRRTTSLVSTSKNWL